MFVYGQTAEPTSKNGMSLQSEMERTISGNETDSQVDFIATSGGYKIKLHNYDLYLSADSSSNGANVYWSASSSSLYQVWSLTPV